MSIVSALLGGMDIGYNRAWSGSIKNNIRYGHPVGFEKGEPHFEQYEQHKQMPHFNISKGIRKPCIAPDFPLHGKPGMVPLKCNQYGSHAGGMLFFGDQPTQVGPLKVPVYEPTNLHQDQTEEYSVDFPVPRNYNAGIRPTIQPLVEHSIIEPAPKMFRPAEVQYTHHRVLPVPTRFLPDDEIVREVRGL